MTKPSLSSSTKSAKAADIKLLPFHPLANLFEPLKDKELDELAGDIKRRGQRFPITTYKGQIIDGRNRALACARIGLEPKYQEFDGSEEDIPRFIISANIHRRHLTPEQRRNLIKRFLQDDPTKSDRTVADITKTSPSTVGAVRKATVQSGQLHEPAVRTGKDGYKRRMPKPSQGNGAAAPEPAADEGDPNLKAMANKIAADAAEIKARRDREEREALTKREAESASNVVAAVAERAAQSAAKAKEEELEARELKARAVQAMPGEIDPLKDGALAVDAATLARRETLAKEIRGLMGKAEPTAEQPDDDDAEIQELLALDDAALAKHLTEKTDVERQELRTSLHASQPKLRNLYNLGVRLESLLGTAADAIGPQLADHKSGAHDSADKLVARWKEFKAAWLRASPAARHKFLDDYGNEVADVFKPAKKPASKGTAKKATKAAPNTPTVIKVSKSKKTASSSIAALEFDSMPVRSFGLDGWQAPIEGGHHVYRIQENADGGWSAQLLPDEGDIKTDLANREQAERACERHYAKRLRGKAAR